MNPNYRVRAVLAAAALLFGIGSTFIFPHGNDNLPIACALLGTERSFTPNMCAVAADSSQKPRKSRFNTERA